MQVVEVTKAAGPPRLAVGIPTRNEAKGITLVLGRIAQALAGEPAAIMVLDDSDDATGEQVAKFAATAESGPHQITLAHRDRNERRGRLATAVMLGLELASSQEGPVYFAVIDGDGQHDEGAIRRMLATAEQTGADVVVASRYIDGGEAGGLSASRLVVSRGVTLLTKAMFPRRLAGLTDVASGLFLVRIKSVRPELVHADGFKILLSLLVAHDWSKAEVAYMFGDRVAGTSKAGAAEGIRFLRLVAILRLRCWHQLMRLAAGNLLRESMRVGFPF